MKKKTPFTESKTIVNLARSFASETMEGAKYQFMAQMCITEKYNYLQNVLKTVAKHEMSHAKVFWDLIQQNRHGIINNIEMTFGYPFECGELQDNFKFSSENESYLSEHIYPQFAKIARDEGYPEIEYAFKLVATVENCHSLLLKQIYSKMKNNKLYKSNTSRKWKCDKCGFEHTAKQAFKVCPLCNFEQGYVEVPFDMGE